MPDRLATHDQVRPKDRVVARREGESVTFFPNEVARALAIESIDYKQMRDLYRLIRDPSGEAGIGPGWSRYSVTDVACLTEAIRILGGPKAFGPGRRVPIKSLARACKALHSHGYPVPLLNVDLVLDGRSVLASVDGLLLDPTSGQLHIGQVARRVDRHLGQTIFADKRLAALVAAEIKRHRHAVPRRLHPRPPEESD